MKKIVFLFLIILCIGIPTHPVNAQTKVFDCLEGELEVSFGGNSVQVIKRGADPFIKTISDENFYSINNALCTDEHVIIYGFSHTTDAPTYYDGLMIVFSSSGDVEMIKLIDYEGLEEVKSLDYMDNTYMLHLELNTNDRDYLYLADYIISYNEDFEEVATHEFSQEIKRKLVKDNIYLLSFNYQGDYDYGILSNNEVLSNESLLSLESYYTSSVYIPFINQGFLNGETVENGILVTYPGNYSFSYNNQIYDFVLEPTISGVEDQTVYQESKSFEVSAGNVLVNNELYIQGSSIDFPGNYDVIIEGINGYTKELSFTISAQVEGVINNQDYNEDLAIVFLGTGYLNNNTVTSPLVISNPGEYVLRVVGQNGYSEVYEFTYTLEEKQFSLAGFIQNIDIFLLIITMIGGVVLLRKKIK